LKNAVPHSKGGHGRKRKLQALNTFKGYEKRYVENLMHKYSSEIIKFLIKNNVGILRLEDISSQYKSSDDKKFSLRYWSSYKLQSLLTYKCVKFGIETKIINAKNSGKICSKCKHDAPENKVDGSTFKCVKCGHETNVDLNNAFNILNIGNVVEKTTKRKKKTEETVASE
jgi:IS605 OrfB family transposase